MYRERYLQLQYYIWQTLHTVEYQLAMYYRTELWVVALHIFICRKMYELLYEYEHRPKQIEVQKLNYNRQHQVLIKDVLIQV